MNPTSEGTHTALGIAYMGNGDTGSAVESFTVAMIYNPQAGVAIFNLLNICMMECDWNGSHRYGKLIHNLTLESLDNEQVPAETPFINLARCGDPNLNMCVAKAWSKAIEI